MKRIKCKYCNKLLKFENLEDGYEYYCPRCESLVYRTGESNTMIASLTISSLIIFLFAITLPLLNVNILYDTQVSIIQSIVLLYESDIFSSLILAFTIIFIPVFMMILILFIIFNQQLNISKDTLKLIIANYIFIKEWNMLSIYFIGLLVSMVKINDISDMTILPGLWVNALLVVSLYLTIRWFNPYDILHINRRTKIKNNSALKTSIYLLIAIIFVAPANLLPIMPIYKYSVYFPNTLLDGVISFWNEGDFFISIVILLSSIILPIVKIVGIFIMLIMLKYDIFSSNKILATKFYIFISKIGKFSMIDVYVVVLASSFIKYDDLLRIEIGTAFIPFTLVVFFTVLANQSLDTKLIWNKK